MQIAFVSNYINHHQAPLSDRLFELTGGEYTFVQTEPMEEDRIRLGWNPDYANRPYVKLYYEQPEACDDIIMKSDCVIFGGCENTDIIMPRLLAGKLTLVYSERIYKEGRWKFVSPRGLKKKYHDHTRFNNSPVYLLCAGAHVKGDFKLIRAYRNKMMKFGYFPKVETYKDLHELRAKETTEILWAGRFIDWKHPEMMLTLAENLIKAGKRFHISMIGNGELENKIHATAIKKGLSHVISFEGSKSPEEVREAMRRADIFISTSDRLEGWGAVVNEAMNSGCVTLASKAIGSAPYLIKNGVNGFTYRACSNRELLEKTLLSFDRELARKLGNAAYNTITRVWNGNVAAERIFRFVMDKEHKMPDYEDGPLSEA